MELLIKIMYFLKSPEMCNSAITREFEELNNNSDVCSQIVSSVKIDVKNVLKMVGEILINLLTFITVV